MFLNAPVACAHLWAFDKLALVEFKFAIIG